MTDYTVNSSTQHPAFALQFTGKERDAETGLDYFGARYFSAAQGRFMTPDWSAKPQPVPYADFTKPQSLNLYSYLRKKKTWTPLYYFQAGKQLVSTLFSL